MQQQIIYPPILPSTIPAFWGDTLKFSFTNNSLNNYDNLIGIQYKITSITGEKILSGLINSYSASLKTESIFSLIDTKLFDVLKSQTYYKIFLAYVMADSENSKIGTYSSPTVGLYLGKTSSLTVEIKEMPNSSGLYRGIYRHEEAPQEKEFSYQFVVGDEEGNILQDSGLLYHDISQDESYTESIDDFYLDFEMQSNKIYFIKYQITTVHQIQLTDSRLIHNTNIYTVPIEDQYFKFYFAPIEECCDSNNGVISIKVALGLTKQPIGENEKLISGSFKLQRAEGETSEYWWDITTFSLNSYAHFHTDNDPLQYMTLVHDCSVASGKIYRYRIVQYNESGCQNIIGEPQNYSVTFDGIFLADDERQLNVIFNPTISSFKSNILQSKIETIGSKYPWINTNGIVNYKEFPISGLISYHMDSNFFFFTEEEAKMLNIYDNFPLNQISNRDFNLTDINLNAEQYFKLKVLDFLNNGKVKLFRSATEGNYFVRLTNVSLTPQQTLGRMLHTFSCTAYEVAPITKQNIQPFFKSLFEENNFFDNWDKLKNSNETVITATLNDIQRNGALFPVFTRERYFIKKVNIIGPPGAWLQFLLIHENDKNDLSLAKVITRVIGLSGNLTVDVYQTPYFITQIATPYRKANQKYYGLTNHSLTMQLLEESQNENDEDISVYENNNYFSNFQFTFVLQDVYKYTKSEFDCVYSIETAAPQISAGILENNNDNIIFTNSLERISNDEIVLAAGSNLQYDFLLQQKALLEIYLFRLTNLSDREAKITLTYRYSREQEDNWINTDIKLPGYGIVLLWQPDFLKDPNISWPVDICLSTENENIQYEFFSKQSIITYTGDFQREEGGENTNAISEEIP